MTTTITHPTKLSLAQNRAQDIRARLAGDIGPKIAKLEQELLDIDAITRDWRTTAANVGKAEQVVEDRARLQRRLEILQDVRRRAEADLREAEAAIEVDSLDKLRADLDTVGQVRVKIARDIMATTEMLAALIQEHDARATEMTRIADRAAKFIGRPAASELVAGIGRVSQQRAVELVMAKGLPRNLWSSLQREQAVAKYDLVELTDSERKYTAIALDRHAQALVDAARAAA